jgi:regulatory protein
VEPYVLALGWLARRELTEKQVRQRLARKGCEPEAIDDAVARLKTERALDDQRVAGAFARTAVRLKGRGPLRLTRDLQALGVDRQAARDAVQDVLAETDEATLARQAVARRWRRADRPEPADAARLYRALLRQGFGPSSARAAITALGAPDDDTLADPPGRDDPA